jgi:hypothetical protein
MVHCRDDGILQAILGELKILQSTYKRGENAPPLFANGLIYHLCRRERGKHYVARKVMVRPRCPKLRLGELRYAQIQKLGSLRHNLGLLLDRCNQADSSHPIALWFRQMDRRLFPPYHYGLKLWLLFRSLEGHRQQPVFHQFSISFDLLAEITIAFHERAKFGCAGLWARIRGGVDETHKLHDFFL